MIVAVNWGVSHFFGKGPDCVADPFGIVPVGDVNGPRKRKTNRENARTNRENPGKSGKFNKKDKKMEGQKRNRSWTPPGNFRPGASFSQNTFSGHATDFLWDVLCWGKNHPYCKICREIDVNLSFWCSFDYLDNFPNIVQVIWIKVWMAVTKLTHSKQKVDVCRFVRFSVRSLLCKSFWADSSDFQAEAKMCRLLGKVGLFFVRVKKQFSGKTLAIFSETLKMCRFLEKSGENRSENPICRFQGKLGWFSVRK